MLVSQVKSRSKRDGILEGQVGETADRDRSTIKTTAKKRLGHFRKKNHSNSREDCAVIDMPTISKNDSSTPIAVRSGKKLSLSTPRRRINRLANLQSTLSPKYIGFSIMDEGISNSRQTRLHRSLLEFSNKSSSNEEVSLAVSSNLSPSKKYVNKSLLNQMDRDLQRSEENVDRSIGTDGGKEKIDNVPLSRKKSKTKSSNKINVTWGSDIGGNDEIIIERTEAEADADVASEEVSDGKMKSANKTELLEFSKKLKVIIVPECTTNTEKRHSPETNDKAEEPGNTDIEQIVDVADKNRDMVGALSPSTLSMDSAKGSSEIIDSPWLKISVGDIFWGQIFTYSYWPCMVCTDPEGRTITTAESGRNKEQHVMVHVRFFADNARRNWVKYENLMKFEGLSAYENLVEEITTKYGKKSSKAKLYLPRRNNQKLWETAVSEASTVAECRIEERLEKFYEIYEKNRSLQKMERKRRQSMYMHRPQSTSDFGSLYGSTDNVSVKRDRSNSPISPEYSPLKPMMKRARFRGDADTTATTNDRLSLDSTNSNLRAMSPIDSIHSKIFYNDEFEKFFGVIKDYVMEQNTDEKLERSLMVAVRNIWGLKHINQTQMQQRVLQNYNADELGSTMTTTVSKRGANSIKRLSNRIKTISIRRSLQSQPIETLQPLSQGFDGMSTFDGARSDDRKKKTLNRPIEEVINDIFSLDTKYLFQGLSRDPVCKYCHRPGRNLQKCSKGCLTWLHGVCIAEHSDDEQRIMARRKLSKTGKRLSIDQGEGLGDVEIGVTSENNNVESNVLMAGYEQGVFDHVDAETDLAEPIICRECTNNDQPQCVVCSGNDTSGELVSCNQTHCGKFYHPSCCRYWPQAKIVRSKNSIESFRCPSHVCHTCVSDNPKGKFQHINNSKLTKCVKCPASYHMDSTCIPAGSKVLTAAHIVCPRHSNAKADVNVNVNWCFICVGGGQLICCETCPIAVHAVCLNLEIKPNEGYICEECESGRLPLYGEIVWAKFTSFRWWPAIILPPTEVPQNILRKAHNPLDFVVRFFGTHDHGWISRRRVYLYVEGDTSTPPKSKKYLDVSYNNGVEEAKKFYDIIKSKKRERMNDDKQKLHPQPYVKIKSNRPVPPVKVQINLSAVNKCSCHPWSESPCGPDSNCLNRVLYHECNPKICPAGNLCQNQMFESKKSPRLDVVYVQERGFGLVTREAIATGTFIIEYVGEIINDEEFKRRLSQKSDDREENYYFLSVERDYIIDAGPKGNLARFMNHSCDPNCETQKWLVNGVNRIGLFAIKDIEANSELTFNYHWDELLGSTKRTCHCGAEKCAGEIGAKIKEDKSKATSAVSNQRKTKATRRKPRRNITKSPKVPEVAVDEKLSGEVNGDAQVDAAAAAGSNGEPVVLK